MNVSTSRHIDRQSTPAANSRLPQWGLKWLNQDLCFYQHLCLVDSEVLRNPTLQQAAKPLCPMPTDSVPTMNRLTKHKTKSQRFIKLKEVQANTQSQRICTTFNFTPTHNRTSNFNNKY